MTLVGAPDLHSGSSGQWVTYLQQLLEASDVQPQRWTVPITGRFDAATEHAVKAVQKFVGWPESGRVDGQLWQKLYGLAQGMEDTEAVIGQLAGDKDAGHHVGKLEPGQEAGRQGWHPGNLTFIVLDAFGSPRDLGAAYVRLRSTLDGSESDEAGNVDPSGMLLHNVWIPDEGTLTLYVATGGSAYDHVVGTYDLHRGHAANMVFHCRQAMDPNPIVVTQDTAGNWTDSSGATVKAGIDVEIASIGGEMTASSTVGGSHADHVQTTAHRLLPHMDITLN